MAYHRISRIVAGFTFIAFLVTFQVVTIAAAQAQEGRGAPARGPMMDDPESYPGAFPEEGAAPPPDQPPQAARQRLMEELNRLRQHKDDGSGKTAFTPPLPTKKKGGAGAQPEPASAETKLVSTVSPEIDRLVSPLLIFHFSGTQPSDGGVRSIHSLLQEGAIAGVVISHQNVSSRAQLKELLKFLSSYPAAAKLRPLIAANETGGTIESLPPDPGFHTPRQLDVAQKRDPQYAYSAYQTMASNLASLGFNMNFGPWLSGAGRSREEGDTYGADPLQAAVFAKTFLMGHKESGVIAAPLITPLEGESLALKALLVSFPNTPVAISTRDDATAAQLQITAAAHGARFCFIDARVGFEGAAVIAHLKKGCDGIVIPIIADKPEAVRLRIGQAMADALARNILDVKLLAASSQRLEALRESLDKVQ